MNNLNSYDISLIGIRLLSIYFGMQAINSSFGIITALPSSPLGLPNSIVIALIIRCIFLVTVPIILWSASKKLAAWIGNQPPAYKANSTSNVDWQSIIFCSVGVFILISTLPDLATWIIMYFSTLHVAANQFDPFTGGLLRPDNMFGVALLLKVLLSLVLMFKARMFSRMLHKLRYAD